MARLISDMILDQGEEEIVEILQSATSPSIDPKYSGQGGHGANLGFVGPDGRTIPQWVASADHIKQMVVPVVLEFPYGFDALPNPQGVKDAWKALVEIGAQKIDGLKSTLTMEFNESKLGHNLILKSPTMVKEEQSDITYEVVEKLGKPIKRLVDGLNTMLIGDKETQTAQVTTLSTYTPALFAPDMYAGVVLFYEPDPTNHFVTEAWLAGNFFFAGGCTNEGSFELGGTKEGITYTIPVPAFTVTGPRIKKLAQLMLEATPRMREDISKAGLFSAGRSPDADDPTIGYAATPSR